MEILFAVFWGTLIVLLKTLLAMLGTSLAFAIFLLIVAAFIGALVRSA